MARRNAQMLMVIALSMSACSDPPSNLVCPLLAPGASALMPQGATLVPTAEGHTLSGNVGPGALVKHPLWLAAGESVKISATLQPTDTAMLAIAYGPRDVFGGYPFCTTIAAGGSLTIEAETAGEYLVLVGRAPGEDAAAYEVTATCSECANVTRCPTLADQGCADVRCDGELASDDQGCLTCTCDGGALCGPDRAAGPGGTCLLPGCDCPDDDEPVCGSDGNTYRSACHALCAAVPIAKDETCAIACPALEDCEEPCFGLRALGSDGCPTCACLDTFAENPESCAACPEASAPVCGSDGVTYRNRCKARCAGARVMLDGACVAGVTWPSGCSIDCTHGLRPVAGTSSAFACDCAPAPTLTCPERGAPVCATVPGPVGQTTVPSACVAVALGASDATWGACGLPCEDDDACPDDAHCQLAGFFAGRCLLNAVGCGCAAQVDPVCGRDGATYDNACVAHCAGVAVAYQGECCVAPEHECADGEIATLDVRGCASGCGDAREAVCAPDAAITATACDLDGVALEGDACSAHYDGVSARPEACP